MQKLQLPLVENLIVPVPIHSTQPRPHTPQRGKRRKKKKQTNKQKTARDLNHLVCLKIKKNQPETKPEKPHQATKTSLPN